MSSNQDCEMERNSDNSSEDPVMLSYATICEIVKLVLRDTEIPYTIKAETEAINNDSQGEVSTNVPELHEVPDLAVQTSAVSVLNQVSLTTMAKA